jgi:hypothetical protein
VRGPESLLGHLLPRVDIRQVHEAWVPAPGDVVYSAVKQVTGREVRVLMPLEFLRWLPGFLIGRRPFWPDPSAPLLAGLTVGVVPLGERSLHTRRFRERARSQSRQLPPTQEAALLIADA